MWLLCYLDGSNFFLFYYSFSSVIGAYQFVHKLQNKRNNSTNSTNTIYTISNKCVNFYSRLHLTVSCVLINFFFSILFNRVIESRRECTTEERNKERKKSTQHTAAHRKMLLTQRNFNETRTITQTKAAIDFSCSILNGFWFYCAHTQWVILSWRMPFVGDEKRSKEIVNVLFAS